MFEQIFTLSAFIWCSIGTGIGLFIAALMRANDPPCVETVLIAVAVVALFGIVGHFDYEDAKREEISYCENVKSGQWPDYEGTYAKVCEAEYGKPKKFTNSSL